MSALMVCIRRAAPSNRSPSGRPRYKTRLRLPAPQAAEVATTATESLMPQIKVDVHGVGKTDPRSVWKQRLSSVLAFCTAGLVITTRDVAAVQRGSKCAEIDEKEIARAGIASN